MAFTLESIGKRVFGRETTEELEAKRSELKRSIEIVNIKISAQLPTWEKARDAWNTLSRGATTNREYSLAQMDFHAEARRYLALCSRRDGYKEQLKRVERKLEKRKKR